MHTTNYFKTFISVADDCLLDHAQEPPKKVKISQARALFEVAQTNPYVFTSDELIIQSHVFTKNIPKQDIAQFTDEFFTKGQPCLRCSALVKRYGWGIHYNADGKVALVPLGSKEYKNLMNDSNLEQKKGMKTKR